MVTRQQMTTTLTGRSPTELWEALLGHARTLQPFWTGAIRAFASRTALPDEKRDGYLGVIDSAFDRMDQWRRGTLKYIKARRNEIDSAISYLRNKAIEAPNRRLLFAPAARNAAGTLRVCLTVSARGYDDAQLPELVAGAIYDVAAVRTLFPYDFGNLMVFHPGADASTKDPLDATLLHAGRQLGVTEAVNTLLVEVNRIWEAFRVTSPLSFPAGYWNAEGDDADVQLRSAAIAAFHNGT